MIDAAMRAISQELDQFVRLQTAGEPGLVLLSPPFDITGLSLPDTAEKLLVFLMQVERQVIPTRAVRQVDTGLQQIGLAQPPVHLDLCVMVAANFTGTAYAEALRLIGLAVAFFQSRPVLNRFNTPALPASIDQLSLEIENLDVTRLSQIWGINGGHYLPSVLYRVRMVTIDQQRIEQQLPRVEQPVVDPRLIGAA